MDRNLPVVISHERSGTHFLMNTIGINFGYNNVNWTDYESFEWHPYAHENVLFFFHDHHKKGNLKIVKSHHSVEFYSQVLHKLAQDYKYKFFYIYRNGEDVMRSFCRHIKDVPWKEGPVCDRAEDFAKAEPWGGCLRYQMRQYPTMWDRWKGHVNGWLGVPNALKRFVCYVRYEDLNEKFEETVEKVGAFLERPVGEIRRPDRDKNVVTRGFINV